MLQLSRYNKRKKISEKEGEHRQECNNLEKNYINKNNLSKKVIPIGVDRCRFISKELEIDSDIYKMHLEKGEKVEILDRATGEIIGLSEFNMTINSTCLGGTDDYKIKINILESLNRGFLIDVNIPKILYGTNEVNVSNLEDLNKVPAIIEGELANVGVFVNMSIARITYLEVNINTNDEKVYGAMNLIRKAWNKTDEKIFITELRNRQESLMKKNSHLKIKVYDKIKQLIDTKQTVINENLVRIELSTKHSEVLKRITKGNRTIKGLIENWDKLESWFLKNLDKHVKKECDNFIDEAIKNLARDLKSNKTYDVLFSHAEQGNLIDIELFEIAMKKYYKEVGKKSPYTMIKNTKKRLEVVNPERYKQLQGNINALDSLWSQIGLK